METYIAIDTFATKLENKQDTNGKQSCNAMDCKPLHHQIGTDGASQYSHPMSKMPVQSAA